MTEQQIRDLGPALARFLGGFRRFFAQSRTAGHFADYCRGLLSELPRKSVEPIALASGTAVRTLQEFLRDHDWSFPQARERLQGQVAALLPSLPEDGLGNVGLIDETASVKSGTQTPGVKRQWCGHLGKTENGVVTVHLGVCRGRYKSLCDTELYVPEDWAADRERC